MTDEKNSMKSLKAYEKIRDMILSGFKLPGTRLVISELEKELGIGRGPIREALMRLDRSGLVKNVPYKGAIVATPPTQQEIFHIYKLRVELETTLAEAAVENITGADQAKLEELHQLMMTLPPEHYQYDREFHCLIYDRANLPHLFNIAQTLMLSVESFLNMYRWEKNYCLKFNDEHQAILHALSTGDKEQVKTSFRVNIQSGLEIIEDTYNKLLKTPFA